eukprot:3622039-Rhodomonas_salina.1
MVHIPLAGLCVYTHTESIHECRNSTALSPKSIDKVNRQSRSTLSNRKHNKRAYRQGPQIELQDETAEAPRARRVLSPSRSARQSPHLRSSSPRSPPSASAQQPPPPPPASSLSPSRRTSTQTVAHRTP